VRTLSFAIAFLICGSGFSSTAHQTDPCQVYLRDFWSITHFESTWYWDSERLRNVQLRDLPNGVARGQYIAKQFFDRRSEWWAEALRYMPAWTERVDSPLKTVFRAAELLNYTKAAGGEARALDALLEGDAKILQFGGGTGWLAGYLLSREPLRRLDVVDPYPENIDLAKRRLRVLLPTGDLPSFVHGLMNSYLELPDNHYDAMLVQRMYYRLGEPLRVEFFRRARATLKDNPFARLIMIEPIEGRGEMVLPWTLKVIEEAVTLGSPHTEFDAAIVAMIMAGTMGQGLTGHVTTEPRPVKAAEVVQRAESEGFVLRSRAPSHDGFCDVFIFGRQ
jgi:hypothetical protein